MSFVGSNIIAGASGQGGSGYAIERSLRFNSADSSYLNKSLSANVTTFTMSFWFKYVASTRNDIYVTNSSYGHYFYQHTDGSFRLNNNTANLFISNGRYRDPSAWYHIVVTNDGSNFKLYVNGVLDKSVSTGTYLNSGNFYIGNDGASTYANCYLAEVHFIDGQALAPTDFGETDEFGVWQPKKFEGTYGTNGFHLDFKNNSSNAALGTDTSGNSNTWTVNNLMASAPGLATANQGMDVVTWTGNGGDRDIGGLAFQPDFVWIKKRNSSSSGDHMLYDVVRGATKVLKSNSTAAEITDASTLDAFNSDGFSIGGGWEVNNSGDTYVSWAWKAGGAASSNTDGTITSSVSANNTYGFSIVSFTDGGSACTVGHGLSSAPKMIFAKFRGASGNWSVYHEATGNDHRLRLNLSDAKQSGNDWWNATSPTSSVFSLGSNLVASTTQIAYCWSEVAGFSKFGSYTGTGAAGVVVTTGFKPRFILIKNVSTGSDWRIFDTARSPSNPADKLLFPNATDAEKTNSDYNTDITATGFTVNGTHSGLNTNGDTYIYAAYASKPSGEGIDSLVDTPTNGDTASDTGAGGEVVGNYATLNPLQNINNDTFSDGNLKVSTSGGNYSVQISTIAAPLTGKWYAEVLIASTSGYDCISIVPSDATLTSTSWGQNIPNAVSYGAWNGSIVKNTSSVATGATFTTNDIIGIAYDADNSTVVFYKNNVAQPTVTSVAAKQFFFASSDYDASASGVYIWNFGQRAFANTNVPSGYKSLNTANLPEPTIADGSQYFDTKLYTGNGGTQSITMDNSALSPDFVWIKCRNDAIEHQLFDSVRGVLKSLRSDNNSAEATVANSLTAFDSNGFSLGAAQSVNHTKNYAAWAWDAGSSTTTIAAGGLNSSVYDQSQNWTSGWISEATGNSGDTFDGIFGANGQGGSNYLVWSPASAVSYSDALGGVEVYTSTNNSGYNNWAYKVNPTSTSYSSSAPSDLSSFISPYEINSGVQSGWTKISTGDGSLTSVGMWNKNASESGIYMNGLKVNGKILVDSGVTPTNVPSVASTVRANPSAGFSICTYTGNNTAGASVGHGLNAAVEFLIVKSRDQSGQYWHVWHSSLANNEYIYLNVNNAKTSGNDFLNGTAPGSSVFTLGSGNACNKSGDSVVAYCFAPVEGYSAMGSYTGNGNASGPFVFTGFRPRLILIKRAVGGSANWCLYDSARDTFNDATHVLCPDTTGGGNPNDAFVSDVSVDFLSNGFRIVDVDGEINANTNTYIYYAVSEHPFKAARAR